MSDLIYINDFISATDLDHIRSLFREYQAAFLTDVLFQNYLTLQNFETELANLPNGYAPPYGALLLALYDGLPAGCVALKRLEDGVCEMKRLYVRPEHRDRKIGALLVEGIITKARALAYELIRLDSLPSMKRAQTLYASFGFHEIPPYCESPVSDAVYMELTL